MGQSKRNYENLITMNSQSFYDYEYYNLIQSNDKRRSTPKIEKVVVEKLQVPAESLFNKSKKRNHIDARQIYFYLCKDRNIRPCYIQDYILSEHNHKMAHSNILYGQEKLRMKCE